MRKNCSSDREKLLKFEAESREFSKFLKSLEHFFLTVGQNNFGNKIPFLTCSLRFLIPNYNEFDQLKIKLEEIIGI